MHRDLLLPWYWPVSCIFIIFIWFMSKQHIICEQFNWLTFTAAENTDIQTNRQLEGRRRLSNRVPFVIIWVQSRKNCIHIKKITIIIVREISNNYLNIISFFFFRVTFAGTQYFLARKNQCGERTFTRR